MKAVLSVIGKDKRGIIARVSGKLYEMGVNIEDISQTIMQDYFTMIMLIDVPDDNDFPVLCEDFNKLGAEIGVSVTIQHEGIFNAMHRI